MLLTRHPADHACPSCAATWPSATARFCGHCGDNLDRAPRRDEPSDRGPSRWHSAAAVLAGLALAVATTTLSASMPSVGPATLGGPGTVALPDDDARIQAPPPVAPELTPDRATVRPWCHTPSSVSFSCVRWSVSLPHSSNATAVVTGDQVLVTPDGGATVRSYELGTGDQLWRQTLRGEFARLLPPVNRKLPGASLLARLGVPVVHGSSVSMLEARPGGAAGFVWRRDGLAAPGRWQPHLQARVSAPSLLLSDGRRVLGLSLRTGATEWGVPRLPPGTTPTLTEHGVVLVGRDGVVELLDSVSGTVAVATQLAPPVAVAGAGSGVLYLVDGDGALHAFDVTTGDQRWTSAATAGSRLLDRSCCLSTRDVTLHAADGAMLLLGVTREDGDRLLRSERVALDPEDGSLLWRHAVADPLAVRIPPAVDNTVVVAAAGAFPAPQLVALDRSTGAVLWTADTLINIGEVAVTDDVVLAAGGGGLVAHAKDSGQHLWRLLANRFRLVATEPLVVAGDDVLHRLTLPRPAGDVGVLPPPLHATTR